MVEVLESIYMKHQPKEALNKRFLVISTAGDRHG
ncbi:MAG: hypothetical protein FD120_1384, partial [Gammaproteobacteria bacterium]